jgi:sucrose-phosphate synthase
MTVFIGEAGDTDYEGLHSGAHKTVILKGCVKAGSENLLRSSGSYAREDVIPSSSAHIVCTENNYSTEEITKALNRLN